MDAFAPHRSPAGSPAQAREPRPPRRPATFDAVVVDVRPARWVGGPVLEVAVRRPALDPAAEGATVWLAFFGRTAVGGIVLGRRLTVTGRIVRRDGRPWLLNPAYELCPPVATPARSVGSAAVHNGHREPAENGSRGPIGIVPFRLAPGLVPATKVAPRL